MFQPNIEPRREQPETQPVANPHRELGDAPSLSEVFAPHGVDRINDLLDPAVNVAQALNQRRDLRVHDHRRAKVSALHQNTIGGILMGGAGASLMLVPPVTFEHPFVHGFAAFSLIVGLASAVQAQRIAVAGATEKHSSEAADRNETSPAFERAELGRRGAHSREDLLEAGRRYLSLLHDGHGAQIIAKSLIGVTVCVRELGAGTREGALLLRDIEHSLSPNYIDLPVERALANMALQAIETAHTHFEKPTDRHLLARSVGRIARIGLAQTREESVCTATTLYQTARRLPEQEAVMRVELLASAFLLTRANDPIRENVESFITEIVNSMPRASTEELLEFDGVQQALRRSDIAI